MLLAASAIQHARAADDVIAQCHAMLARACLERAGASGRRLLRIVDTGWGRALLAVLERLLLPGLSAHYLWRKRRIRHWALQACDARIRQVLILGAGFDGLGLTLLDHRRDLRVFELERPATMQIKRAALQALGLERPQLSLIGVELGGAAPPGLQELQGFDADRPTLVIAEGVLMYLTRHEVIHMLQQLAQALPGGRLIATAMARRTDGHPGFHRQHRLVRHWLRWRGEPFQWGTDKTGLATLLHTGQVDFRRVADPDEATDPDPSPGEWVFAGAFVQQGQPFSAPLTEREIASGRRRASASASERAAAEPVRTPGS